MIRVQAVDAGRCNTRRLDRVNIYSVRRQSPCTYRRSHQMVRQHESVKGRRVRLTSEQANIIRQKAETTLHPALRPASTVCDLCLPYAPAPALRLA